MSIARRGLCPLIQVFDMPASLRFYRDILGFSEVQGTPDPSRVAGHGDIILFLGCGDLDGAHAHLAANGIRADPPKVAPYGMKQLYLNDPDGYGVCLQSPTEPATQNGR